MRNDLNANPQVFFVCNSFEKLGHAPKDGNRHRACPTHPQLKEGSFSMTCGVKMGNIRSERSMTVDWVHFSSLSEKSRLCAVMVRTLWIITYLNFSRLSRCSTEVCKIIPVCLNFRGTVAANWHLSATACQSAIFGKIDINYCNLSGTILHLSVFSTLTLRT